MSASLFMRNAGAYARRMQAQRAEMLLVSPLSPTVPFAVAKRTGRESTLRLVGIGAVPGLPQNRPNLAALRYYNVLVILHDDGGGITERVDRFARGSHSRPKPLVESDRE